MKAASPTPNFSIYNTAEYGRRITGNASRRRRPEPRWKRVRGWGAERQTHPRLDAGKQGQPDYTFKACRAKLAQHQIQEVGAKLRDMMPWIKKGALVDKYEELSFGSELKRHALRRHVTGSRAARSRFHLRRSMPIRSRCFTFSRTTCCRCLRRCRLRAARAVPR